MSICCTCNAVRACPCPCHNVQPVSTVGEGFWLARGIRTESPYPAAMPVKVTLVGGDGALVVWGLSDRPDYGGLAYRTLGVPLMKWLHEHPNVTFVPDRDRTKDEPAPAPPKPDFRMARHVLRDAAAERRKRAQQVREAREVVLREFGAAGLERLESCGAGETYPISCEQWATDLERDADEILAAADALKA